MERSLNKLLHGYELFRKKYASGDNSVMQFLSYYGQKPEVMVVSCCDSRVDPALIMQCDPGDLFVVRNVANIVPPYEKDEAHHGTSAALEFGVCFLKVKHLILLGHSQCGGIQALLNSETKSEPNDFIINWVSIVKNAHPPQHVDEYAKLALNQSLDNCMTFPWIKQSVEEGKLQIHLWFFDVGEGRIYTSGKREDGFLPLLIKE